MFKLYKQEPHFSERKYRAILRYFSEDLNATTTSKLTKISRVTINRIYSKLRKIIAEECEQDSVFESGEIELDESYFGVRRVKGKHSRGRGASRKTPVFGMLKRNGNAYTRIINNCSVSELLPVIEARASKDSTLYTDCFKSYDGLVDYGYKQHYKVKHSNNEFADGRNHINGIENFGRYVRFV